VCVCDMLIFLPEDSKGPFGPPVLHPLGHVVEEDQETDETLEARNAPLVEFLQGGRARLKGALQLLINRYG